MVRLPWRVGQRHHHHLARLLLMPGGEISDWSHAEFIVRKGKAGVQHQQIPLHAQHFFSAWQRLKGRVCPRPPTCAKAPGPPRTKDLLGRGPG